MKKKGVDCFVLVTTTEVSFGRNLIGVDKNAENAAERADGVLRSEPDKLAMIYELPTTASIPFEVLKEAAKEDNSDIITDYISDKYEFAIQSCCLPNKYDDLYIDMENDFENKSDYI